MQKFYLFWLFLTLHLNIRTVFAQIATTQYPTIKTTNAPKELKGFQEFKSSQTNPSNSTLNAGNSFAAPAAGPEAARSNALQDIPVNQYTGSPGISIPLTQISQGRLGVNLSLSYNHNAVQTHNVATWCGLGWDLQGIPTISRIIKDKPDEGYLVNRIGKKGYYYYGPGTNPADEERDKEADIFFLNTSEGSFKFILNIRGEAVFFPVSDIRLTVSTQPNFYDQSSQKYARYFSQFVAIMPDGTQYYFNNDNIETSMEIEVNDQKSKVTWYEGGSDYNEYQINNSQISAWYCRLITSPYFEAITLNYNKAYSSYFKLSDTRANNLSTCPNNASKNINRVYTQGATISEIYTPDLKISFNNSITYSARQDLTSYTFPATFGFPNADNLPSKLLKTITISDNLTNPIEFSTIHFDYDYFSGPSLGIPTGYSYADIGLSHEKRLKLSKITLPDASTYTFQYIAENTPHQSRLSFGIDHWGFANTVESNLNTYGLIGTDYLNICGSDRSAFYTAGIKGMLYKITHSSGSETELNYEQHTASNVNFAIGGARIYEITNRDLIRNVENKKRFSYLTSTNASSGFMFVKPIYNIQYNSLKEANSSLYGQLLAESGRPAVGYSRVKEEIIATDPTLQTGYTVSYFNQTEVEGSIKQSFSSTNHVPIFFNLSHDYLQGVLLKTESFNTAGALLSKTENAYTPLNELIYSSFYQSRLYKFNGGTILTKDYEDNLTHFRLKNNTTTSFGRTGSGIPSIQSTDFTYKNEMPAAYKTTYPGSHQQVVRTTTTDEEGVLLESLSKFAADYSFLGTGTYYCDIECITPTQCDTIACFENISPNPPPASIDASGIYAALSNGQRYLPIETISKRNGLTVGASYQSYYGQGSSFDGLPKHTYGLKTVPKPGFQEAVYTSASTIFSIDPDYGSPVSTVLDFNLKGIPRQNKITYGPETFFGFSTSGLIGISQLSNSTSNTHFQSQAYNSFFRGPSIRTSANGLQLKYEYQNTDSRLKLVKDKDNNILQSYTYQVSPQIPNPSLAFDNSIRSKTCDGTSNMNMKVYVSGLLPLTTAEFSLDAGSTWQAENLGANGFSFNTPVSNSYVNIQARVAGNNTTIINSTYHASCSTIPPVDWGNNTLQPNGLNTCKYTLQVLGLTIDSYAEFSRDNTNWFRPSINNNGFQFILLQGPPGSNETFYFRLGENTSSWKSSTLNTCTN